MPKKQTICVKNGAGWLLDLIAHSSSMWMIFVELINFYLHHFGVWIILVFFRDYFVRNGNHMIFPHFQTLLQEAIEVSHFKQKC